MNHDPLAHAINRLADAIHLLALRLPDSPGVQTDPEAIKALTARLKTANDALTKAVAENQPPTTAENKG